MEKNPGSLIKEACVESLDEAVRAESCGADRIELCSRLDLDGLTPEISLVKEVLSKLTIPVHAMVRPRAGNFIYTDTEYGLMKEEIDELRDAGIQGVVFGILKENNEVNLDATCDLARYASPLKVVFHKAIDVTPDPVESVRRLNKISEISGILTSGGHQTALEGEAVLREMLSVARSEIIVAGKVTRHNLEDLRSRLEANAFHGRRIVYD